MFNPSDLKKLVPMLLFSLLVFGCAHPNAITDENRNTPIEGRGFQLMPPKEGTQWRYGAYHSLGLAGFVKFTTNNNEAKVTVIQGWVVPTGRSDGAQRSLVNSLLSLYLNARNKFGINVLRHEMADKTVNGRKVATLQLWGRHEFPRTVQTKIVRFNAVFYLLPSPNEVENEYFILGGWLSHLTQGRDNPPELKTDWSYVEAMLDGVLPANERSIPYVSSYIARPFVKIVLERGDLIMFYTPLN